MLRQTLDALPFTLVFAVETLGIELIPQAQGFDFTVQAREVCFGRGGKIEPVRARRFVFQLLHALVKPRDIMESL